MKTIRSLMLIISLVLVSSICGAQNDQKQEIAKKYKFIFEPMENQTPKQLKTTLKVVKLIVDNVKLKDKEIVLGISKSEFKKTKLPMELYDMMINDIQSFNRSMAKKSQEDIETMFNSALMKAKMEMDEYKQ